MNRSLSSMHGGSIKISRINETWVQASISSDFDIACLYLISCIPELNCILVLNCILQCLVSVIHYLVSSFLCLFYCILNPDSLIMYPVSCILYPVSCIMGLNCILRFNCILGINCILGLNCIQRLNLSWQWMVA